MSYGGKGPVYGYYPNGTKTYLLVKHEAAETAKEVFKGTGVRITTEGNKYLGGAIGTTSFLKQFMERKIQEWSEEVRTLSDFARTQPHAAYSAFTHGLSARWNYFL